MDGSIIIISILVILLWFYFMKYSEQESKYLSVMLKQKQVISKLKVENVKMKSELKYLHNYKNDVSKTFQILDNELVMINDRIKQTGDQVQNSTQTQPRSSFQTSFNPSILSTLLNSARVDQQSTEPIELTQPSQSTQPTENEQPGGDLFNIFNRFLTGQNVSNFEFSIPPSVQSVNTDTETPIQRGSVQFSTNILPLNNSYRQFLLNRGGSSAYQRRESQPQQMDESEPEPQAQQDNEQEHETSII